MEPDDLRRALIAASDRWRQLDVARDKARDAVFQAAADYLLGSDVLASEVATLTPFSDALVRAETRKLGVPERRRGPQRKQESKPESEIAAPVAPAPRTLPPGPTFLSASDRTAELIAMASTLPSGRHVELVSLLEKNHWAWLRANRLPDDSDWAVVQKAVKAKLFSTSDLMR
jgi:hypothetical protein